MKYDPDIALQILKAMEDYPKDELPIQTMLLNEADEELYYFHCRLLAEAGYISVYSVKTGGLNYYWPREIRLNGVQFLERFRDDSLWQRAKNEATKLGVGMALNTLYQVGTKMAEKLIGS